MSSWSGTGSDGRLKKTWIGRVGPMGRMGPIGRVLRHLSVLLVLSVLFVPSPPKPLRKYALRIVTINTGKCDGPYFPRREAMARQLGALDADVIALQESFASIDGCVTTAD